MIRFEKITKKYDEQTVVSDISFEIEKGDLAVLIGPSGCGKTTLLKIINRLIEPTAGSVYVDGKNILDCDPIKLRRSMGYVIQQTGLFPHMTVGQNISIIPRLMKQDQESIRSKSVELMEMVGLDPQVYLDRYPYELSGGQQQRIGVARAFACDPDIILMDEPFSALDPLTRSQLQDELADLQGRFHKTIVFVTHDMDEAVKIADRICLINEGSIVQYDTVEEIMRNPANDYVAEFIGKNRIWSSPELIRAQDIMIPDPVCIGKEATVLRCIEKMRRHKVDSLMVTDRANRLIGIAFAGTLQNMKDKKQRVSDVMLRQFATVGEEANILEVFDIANSGGLSSIPVVGEDMLLKGLITKSSLLTTVSQQYTDTEAMQ